MSAQTAPGDPLLSRGACGLFPCGAVSNTLLWTSVHTLSCGRCLHGPCAKAHPEEPGAGSHGHALLSFGICTPFPQCLPRLLCPPALPTAPPAPCSPARAAVCVWLSASQPVRSGVSGCEFAGPWWVVTLSIFSRTRLPPEHRLWKTPPQMLCSLFVGWCILLRLHQRPGNSDRDCTGVHIGVAVLPSWRNVRSYSP